MPITRQTCAGPRLGYTIAARDPMAGSLWSRRAETPVGDSYRGSIGIETTWLVCVGVGTLGMAFPLYFGGSAIAGGPCTDRMASGVNDGGGGGRGGGGGGAELNRETIFSIGTD